MILVVGRLIPRKGHMVLLRAMRLLCDLPQVHLMIVGEGQERARLEEAIRRWGLEPCVTLTGRISDADLQQMYRRCHVFVLPAIIDERGDTEMLGMVVPEAMRYAKPVVVTAVGGLVDFVGSGASGLVVAPADPQALAAALRQVLLDDALAARLGAGGYELVQTQFSWPRVEQALLEVYGVQV
jgi:glycosyltransferase involved in cell wall biosynthesis